MIIMQSGFCIFYGIKRHQLIASLSELHKSWQNHSKVFLSTRQYHVAVVLI